uniref:Uncharacterized protein n=1 Tax=Anopheles atroparvus TaxID=41427 RepID=A0A182IMW3_ANOAO
MSIRPSKPTKGLSPAAPTASTSLGSNLSARRKSAALRAGSFDEQQLRRGEPLPPAAARGQHLVPPDGPPLSAQHSPKFFRTQSFGDRLLASSPKFVKSKKIFLSVGPKSSSSTALFFAPETCPGAKGTTSSGFGSRRKNFEGNPGRAPAPVEPPRLVGSTDGGFIGAASESTEVHDPLIAYRHELRQLRQHQKERFRSRSSSISIERWNESASGQRCLLTLLEVKPCGL